MSAQRGRQAIFWTEEIDGPGLSIILGHNAAILALIHGNFVPGDDDLIHNFVPTELVGVVLRKCGPHVAVLASRQLDGQPLHVSYELLNGQNGKRQGREDSSSR